MGLVKFVHWCRGSCACVQPQMQLSSAEAEILLDDLGPYVRAFPTEADATEVPLVCKSGSAKELFALQKCNCKALARTHLQGFFSKCRVAEATKCPQKSDTGQK